MELHSLNGLGLSLTLKVQFNPANVEDAILKLLLLARHDGDEQAKSANIMASMEAPIC